MITTKKYRFLGCFNLVFKRVQYLKWSNVKAKDGIYIFQYIQTYSLCLLYHSLMQEVAVQSLTTKIRTLFCFPYTRLFQLGFLDDYLWYASWFRLLCQTPEHKHYRHIFGHHLKLIFETNPQCFQYHQGGSLFLLTFFPLLQCFEVND